MVSQNVRENRRDNQELTIQKLRPHWTYKTQDEKKPKETNKQAQHRNLKR